MKSDFSVQNNVVNVCCSTLAWCFHILEMSSIHTGEHTKQQRFKSKRRKIVNGKDCVTFHRTTAYHCCHSSFRWFHSVMSDS